jgi:hypothetical protein
MRHLELIVDELPGRQRREPERGFERCRRRQRGRVERVQEVVRARLARVDHVHGVIGGRPAAEFQNHLGDREQIWRNRGGHASGIGRRHGVKNVRDSRDRCDAAACGIAVANLSACRQRAASPYRPWNAAWGPPAPRPVVGLRSRIAVSRMRGMSQMVRNGNAAARRMTCATHVT